MNQVLISSDGKFIAYSVEILNEKDGPPIRSETATTMKYQGNDILVKESYRVCKATIDIIRLYPLE